MVPGEGGNVAPGRAGEVGGGENLSAWRDGAATRHWVAAP